MRAHVNPITNPMELTRIHEEVEKEKAKKKSKKRLSKLNKLITKSVNYYADEEFQKNGGPLRWVD